jgi:large conductance mechanosensitive channel
MIKGFKNFLMRGDVIVVAVGLVIALAFSTLINAFTTNVINPLIAAAQGKKNGPGLGWQLVSGGGNGTYLNIGAFISAIIYFIIFMAVVYFLIVLPYKMVMARKGTTVFGEPAPMQTCPACLSSDLPMGASKCKYCATDLPSGPTGGAHAEATPSPKPRV